ncbi:MAG TPA: cell division topological specificity factor MinE [Candidatus Binatia bacterium]|nr:cell division topological specificity factor MinE [Candidatus Binatia bacterium]
MFDFLSRFFKPQGSSETAKERLRLVLLSDHLQLAPDVVEALKYDLIAVISKYVEVDVESCEVTFEQQDRTVLMLANIPIVSMKVRTLDQPAEPEPIVLGEPELEVQPATVTSHAHAAAPRRRRRRRKRLGAGSDNKQHAVTGPLGESSN